MKKDFNAPKIEIVLLEADVIATSTPTPRDIGGWENLNGHNETPDW